MAIWPTIGLPEAGAVTKDIVEGSKTSTLVVPGLSIAPPPATRTLPLGNNIDVCHVRAVLTCFHLVFSLLRGWKLAVRMYWMADG